MAENIIIPEVIVKIAKRIDTLGGQANLIGGFVRDHLMGQGNTSFDVDVEVFGLTFSRLESLLRQFGKVKIEGQAFAAILLTVGEDTFDFTLPRVDSKTGVGHKGFEVNVDPNMSFKEAARRRDFTINSIAINVLTKEVIDPWNGMRDMEDKILRPTDITLFMDDPLRVLRGIDFACRFDFFLTKEFFEAAQFLKKEFQSLPTERIEKQIFHKWAKKGRKKAQLIDLLERTGWIEFFPELEKNEIHLFLNHPFLFGKPEETMAVLIQRMGEKNKKSFLDRVVLEKAKKLEIIELSNLFHLFISDSPANPKVKQSFFLSKAKIDPVRVKNMFRAFIDHKGNDTEIVEDFLSLIPDKFADLKRLVNGKDLIEMGVKPGPVLGFLLELALVKQCNGLSKELIIKEIKEEIPDVVSSFENN